MGDILDFIVENFDRLQAADYVLLFTFTALATVGLFAIIHRLYASRFKAQSELLEIQKATIESLSSQAEMARDENNRVRGEFTALSIRFAELDAKTSATSAEEHSLRTDSLRLTLELVLVLMERVSLAYQNLLFGVLIASARPTARDLATVERLQVLLEGIKREYNLASQKDDLASARELFVQANREEVSQAADDVWRTAMTFTEPIETAMRNALRGDSRLGDGQ